MFGRLTALLPPHDSEQKPERKTSVQRFRQAHTERSHGSFGHRLCDFMRPI